MMRFLFLLLFISGSGNDALEIARVNKLKREAESAFKAGDYAKAATQYRLLIDSMNVKEQEINLNLAHAYFQQNDTAQARSYYSSAAVGSNAFAKSAAYQQLGVMAKNGNALKESLSYLKESIKSNPANTSARYDYEIVKKLLDKQKEQEQNQDKQDQEDKENKEEENKDQENKDQENKEGDKKEENKDQEDQQNQQEKSDENKEGEEKEQKEQEQKSEESKEEQSEQQQKEQNIKDKLEQMNIPQEKAMMILEAMKNSEIQYLQQQKRKATERPKTGKPDW